MMDNNLIPTDESKMASHDSLAVASKRVENLLAIMKQLNLLIDGENKAIKAHDYKKVKELQESKVKLTSAYVEAYKAVGPYKEMLKSLSEEMKSDLKKMTKKLNDVMENNSILLRAGIGASKRLLETIVKAAESKAQEDKGFYSNTGKLGNKNRYSSALSINTVL